MKAVTHTFSWWEPSLLPDPPKAVTQRFPIAFRQLFPWTVFQLFPPDDFKYWPLTECFQSWNAFRLDVLMSHCVSQMKRLMTVGVCCYFLSGPGNGDTQTRHFATTDATESRIALRPFRRSANRQTHTHKAPNQESKMASLFVSLHIHRCSHPLPEEEVIAQWLLFSEPRRLNGVHLGLSINFQTII